MLRLDLFVESCRWRFFSQSSLSIYYSNKSPHMIFFPLSRHIVFWLPSWPFCLNSSLFCIYFTLLLPLFSFSFPVLPFSFHSSFFFPLSSFSFTISPFFSLPFHNFSPKWHRLIFPPTSYCYMPSKFLKFEYFYLMDVRPGKNCFVFYTAWLSMMIL